VNVWALTSANALSAHHARSKSSGRRAKSTDRFVILISELATSTYICRGHRLKNEVKIRSCFFAFAITLRAPNR
jgi:hypothetical protein